MSNTFTIGLIQKALDLVRREVDPRIEAQTLDLLLRIAQQPESSQVALAEQVGIGVPAVSRNVDKLVKLGLIDRYEDSVDRRLKVTKLTAKGERLTKRLDDQLSKYLKASKWSRE